MESEENRGTQAPPTVDLTAHEAVDVKADVVVAGETQQASLDGSELPQESGALAAESSPQQDTPTDEAQEPEAAPEAAAVETDIVEPAHAPKEQAPTHAGAAAAQANVDEDMGSPAPAAAEPLPRSEPEQALEPVQEAPQHGASSDSDEEHAQDVVSQPSPTPVIVVRATEAPIEPLSPTSPAP
jgi:hypothetical protein